MATETIEKKCAHALCDCQAAPGSDYCGEYCRDAAKTHITDIKCSCEHDNCR